MYIVYADKSLWFFLLTVQFLNLNPFSLMPDSPPSPASVAECLRPRKAFYSQVAVSWNPCSWIPHCLRYFWTSARLYRRLAYIPRSGDVNICFAALRSCGFHAEKFIDKLPDRVAGLHRREAQIIFGPRHHRPTLLAKEKESLVSER